MTAALAARNFNLVPGGDYYCRSRDPSGAYFRRQFFGSSATPVVTLTTPADQVPDLGSTYTAVFTSDIPCSWRMLFWPSDDAVLSVSSDCLVATVTWVIAPAARKTSEYLAVSAETSAGQTITFDRIHVGAASVRRIGVGEAYATLALASISAPTGTRFVLKNGTYTSADQFVNASTLPNGVFTTYTDGSGNTRYTVTEMTTYMAETPYGAILDGSGASQVFFLNGNHGFEQQCLQYDIANSTTLFSASPSGSINRVGIAVKGFEVKGSLGECALVKFCRFIHFQHIFATADDGDKFALDFDSSADVLAEQCFVTGNMRGPIRYTKTLRFVERRCGSIRQNGDGSLSQDGHAIRDCRQGEQWNCFDIDSNDTFEWYTGAGATPGAFTYSVGGFSADIKVGKRITRDNFYADFAGDDFEDDADPDDVYKIHGKQGTFWGDTGYQTELDRDWLDTFNFEAMTALVRVYSYTGSTQTQGTQTLLGNRGGASVVTNLREYLDDAAVQPPYALHIQKIGNDIFIFIRRYYATIREHRVYLNNVHAFTVPSGYHCAQLAQLTGGVYQVKLSCVDNDGVESTVSRATSITL